MQPQPQKKVARAHRIEGSIVLYRSAAKSQFKAQTSLLRAEPWWNMVFAVPLFLRTLLRLVFVCHHWHKGPPVTLRESIPSNLSRCRPVCGRGSYITCLDCGQKFAYNHRTGRLVDFWGIHDTEALAGVRRRINGFFRLCEAGRSTRQFCVCGFRVHCNHASARTSLFRHRASPVCADPPAHSRTRSSSSSRSRALRVSAAARSNSERASSNRPSFFSRSPRTLGKRW
jgi:hypothetical protein